MDGEYDIVMTVKKGMKASGKVRSTFSFEMDIEGFAKKPITFTGVGIQKVLQKKFQDSIKDSLGEPEVIFITIVRKVDVETPIKDSVMLIFPVKDKMPYNLAMHGKAVKRKEIDQLFDRIGAKVSKSKLPLTKKGTR